MPRGGHRNGAGRPPGRRNGHSRKTGRTLRELARGHTEDAITVLLEVARDGSSESARVTAATALLDRGWGRPTPDPPEAIPLRAVMELQEKMATATMQTLTRTYGVEQAKRVGAEIAEAWGDIQVDLDR